MRLDRAHVAAMCRGDKDRATGMSSSTNEEPLVVVKAGVNIVWEVVGKDRGDSRYSVVGKGEASLCRGRYGGILKGTSGTKDRDVSRARGIGGHWGSEVFAAGGGDEDVVGVDGDVLVKRGEKEGVEYFLGCTGRCGRHGW